MRAEQILSDDQGVLWFGPLGEKLYGFRNFMDLTSVFTSPPLFCVKAGKRELGYVHESSFGPQKSGSVILLAGQAWLVTRIDWTRRVAYVEPTDLHGRSRWLGMGPALSYEVCQSMAGILASEDEDLRWSKRAKEAMLLVRKQYHWAKPKTVIVNHDVPEKTQMWTFAGKAVNRTIAIWLQHHLGFDAIAENLYLTVGGHVDLRALSALPTITEAALRECLEPSTYEDWIDKVKFSECLPESARRTLFLRRELAPRNAARVLEDLRLPAVTHPLSRTVMPEEGTS
jgi:ATP-dependent Lhr-like helicase